MPLGKAFQLQDDILGIFGDKAKVGKAVGSDLKEGKKTLLILKALEKSSVLQKQTIKQALGNKNLTNNQLNEVREIIIKTGSLDYSKQISKKLIEKAKSAIDNVRFKQKGKEFLLKLADYLENREY
jgi:geranylgeranyl diphosphate synthase type I